MKCGTSIGEIKIIGVQPFLGLQVIVVDRWSIYLFVQHHIGVLLHEESLFFRFYNYVHFCSDTEFYTKNFTFFGMLYLYDT